MKKFFSLLLVFILLIGAFPFSARAEDDTETFIQSSSDPVKWTISKKSSGEYEIIKMEYNSGYLSGQPSISLPSIYDGIPITSVSTTLKLSEFSHIDEIVRVAIHPSVIIDKGFLSGLGNNSLSVYLPDTLDASYLVGSPNATVTYEDNTKMGWLAGDANDSLYWTIEGTGTSRKLTITTTGGGPFETIPTSFSSNNNLIEASISGVKAIPADLCNSKVKTLTLDNTVASIAANAFPGVTKITFNGTKAEWDQIDGSAAFASISVQCTRINVTFVPGDHVSLAENQPASIGVAYDETIPEPSLQSHPFFTFNSWYYLDGETKKVWDFSKKINEVLSGNPESLTLYAETTETAKYGIEISVQNPEGVQYTLSTDPSNEAHVSETVTISLPEISSAHYIDSLSVMTDPGNENVTINDGNTFTMPDSKVKISAVIKITPKLIVNTSENGTVTTDPAAGSVPAGTPVSINTEPVDGYKLKELSLTPSTITPDEENKFIMPDEDVTITAMFELVDYSITLVNPDEGGSMSVDKTENIHFGDTVTLTAVPGQYKMISDWGVKDADSETIEVTVSANDPNIATFSMPASDVTIHPVFSDQEKYLIGFVNGPDRLYIQLDEDHKLDRKAFAGEQISFTITPPQHYKLNKMEYLDKDENRITVTGNTFIMPASDIKLAPDFVELPKLTHIYLDGDLNPEKPFYSVTFYEDETPSKPITKPTKTADDEYSYTFDKWDEGVTIGNVTTFTPIFKKVSVPHTIEVYAYGDGLVSVDGSDFSTKVTVQAVEGTKLSLKVKPMDNHYFAGFDTAETTGTLTASTFTVGKADARIRATFRENKKVNIKFDPNGGTGTMNPIELTSGATYKLPENAFTPPQGKMFFCWQIEDKTFSIGDSVSVKEDDITIKAVWKDSDQISYTVTFLIDSEYQAAVQTVIKGNKAVKPTDPSKDGYLFVGWYTDSSLSTPFSFDTPIESNMILYAKWTPKAPETDETIEYTVVDGAAQKWTKGTTNTIDIRAKRNIDDNTTLNHFVSLQIDGKALVKGTDYIVSEGSVIVSIKPTALQNLANGIHRVTFVFVDGKADTTLTILEAAEGNSSGGGSSSGGSSVPKTGDIFSNPVIWFGGMLLVMFILRLFIRARKARIAEAAFMQNEKY